MSVRYHEQLFSKQQREDSLRISLNECAAALDEAVAILLRDGRMIPEGIINAHSKYVKVSSNLTPMSSSSSYQSAVTIGTRGVGPSGRGGLHSDNGY